VSVELSWDVVGVEELRVALSRLDSGLQEQVRAFLLGWAERVRDSAMQKSPVRTGYLRSSIYARVDDSVARVGAEAPYAVYVEFGTRRMQARLFLSLALQEHLPELEFNLLGAIDQAKAEAGL